MKKCYYILLLLLMCGCATVEDKDKDDIEYTGVTLLSLDSMDLEELSKTTKLSLEQLQMIKEGGGATYNPNTGEITGGTITTNYASVLDMIAAQGALYFEVSPNPTSSYAIIELHCDKVNEHYLQKYALPFHFKCDIICDEKIIGHFENATSYGKEQIPESLLQKTGT
ncbi:MAG: hypothetical protein LBO69_00555, partial [Ignavibacteria bacterium]|nr:hypothetical protein [Ignavibacteria bacterium]